MTKNQSARISHLVRCIERLRDVLLAFVARMKSLRKRILETHFFPIPSLPTPTLTFRVDDASSSTAAPQILTHLSSLFETKKLR